MSHFTDKVAIVTGGASGIGRSLCKALSERGAIVYVADINGPQAERVAASLTQQGRHTEAAPLDVRDSAAVMALVEAVITQQGRLDFMFNNAGIGLIGDARDMSLDDWQKMIDVNLWGVIYGTHAAYQQMTRQGFGHIVNTASGGGLFPLPLGTAYSTAKFGIVGLSTSLRIEAADLGVKVSVVCPGGVKTDIINSTQLLNINRAEAMANLPLGLLMDADKCAQVILRGVARNRGIITVTAAARLGWWLYRFQPGLMALLLGQTIKKVRGFRKI